MSVRLCFNERKATQAAAHLLDRFGLETAAAAVAAYDRAIDLTADEAVRGFLRERRNALAISNDRLSK